MLNVNAAGKTLLTLPYFVAMKAPHVFNQYRLPRSRRCDNHSTYRVSGHGDICCRVRENSHFFFASHGNQQAIEAFMFRIPGHSAKCRSELPRIQLKVHHQITVHVHPHTEEQLGRKQPSYLADIPDSNLEPVLKLLSRWRILLRKCRPLGSESIAHTTYPRHTRRCPRSPHRAATTPPSASED